MARAGAGSILDQLRDPDRAGKGGVIKGNRRSTPTAEVDARFVGSLMSPMPQNKNWRQFAIKGTHSSAKATKLCGGTSILNRRVVARACVDPAEPARPQSSRR